MNNEREAAIRAIEGKYGFPPSRLCMLFGRDVEWAFQAGAEWQRSQGAPAGYRMVPVDLLERAAESIESELDARYGKPVHPALQKKYASDMVEVEEIRNLLAAASMADTKYEAQECTETRIIQTPVQVIDLRPKPAPPPVSDDVAKAQVVIDQLKAYNERLRAHKNDYMEAAEETRKALRTALDEARELLADAVEWNWLDEDAPSRESIDAWLGANKP